MTEETKALPIALLQPLVSRVRTDVHWKKPKSGPPFMAKVPLTDEYLNWHMTGGIARGACPILAGESTTRVAVLDLDSHKGETSWEEMVDYASNISEYCGLYGVNATAFSSSGGRGIHLYFIWDEPQDAYSVRMFFKGILSTFGTTDGAGGVSNNQVEIFPKQDSVPLDGFGNMFILPYSGESCPLEPLMDYQRMPKDYPIEWPVSAPVPVVAKPERVGSALPSGLDKRLTEAVHALSPDLPYDQWLKVGQAIHHETEGDLQGLVLWDSWSAQGADYPTYTEMEAKWESFGRSSAQPVTAGTIYKMATESGWIDTPSADDFDVVEEVDTQEPASPRFRFTPWHEFAGAGVYRWLIKNTLPEGLIAVYGPPGGGKSFWVLDAVNAIARGATWRDKKVTQGSIAYVCAEGAGGFRKRLTAYGRQHKVSDANSLPLHVLGDAPNLIKKEDANAILHAIQAIGDVLVIVVDTLAQVTPGANENSSEGIGMALRHCRMLHDKTGATVILVAHSGKDSTKGVRGWSGIKAALDCEIEVTRVEDSDVRVASITKQKDGSDIEQKYPFKLVEIPVGVDEDGDPVTSCFVEHLDEIPEITREKKVKMGDNERVLMDVVDAFFEEKGEWPDVDVLINRAVDALPESKTRPAQRKVNLNRSLKSLFDRGLLIEKNGFVSDGSEELVPEDE